jgi:glutathione S-transferase
MHPATKQIRDAIANATDGVSEEQMRQHPEGKWDAAAILEHLALTYGSTARVMQKCLDEGRPRATSANVQHRVAQLAVLTFSYIPSGRKAPKQVVPSGIAGQEALRLILENLEKMDETLARCEQRFGSKVKIADHPVLGPIPVTAWRKFHLLHTRHHMKQVATLTATYSRVGSDVAAAS